MRTGVRMIRLIRHLAAVTLGERSVAATAETAQQIRHLFAGSNAMSQRRSKRLTPAPSPLPLSERFCAIAERD